MKSSQEKALPPHETANSLPVSSPSTQNVQPSEEALDQDWTTEEHYQADFPSPFILAEYARDHLMELEKIAKRAGFFGLVDCLADAIDEAHNEMTRNEHE